METNTKIQDAVAQYKTACILQGQAFDKGNFKKANKYFEEETKCVDFLKENNALNELFPFLYEEDENLRISTAAVLMHIDTNACLAVLNDIANKSHGVTNINAEMTISEFKKGHI